jgi:hypothetical protein
MRVDEERLRSENDSLRNDGSGAMFFENSDRDGRHLLKLPRIVLSSTEQQFEVKGLHATAGFDCFVIFGGGYRETKSCVSSILKGERDIEREGGKRRTISSTALTTLLNEIICFEAFSLALSLFLHLSPLLPIVVSTVSSCKRCPYLLGRLYLQDWARKQTSLFYFYFYFWDKCKNIISLCDLEFGQISHYVFNL